MGRFSQIFGELKRRNVHRAGAAYLVLAWVIVQVADIILDAFIAPTWVIQFIVIALVAGLPVTLVLSWVYEITTSGVKRTEDVSLEESITYVTGRKLDFTIIGFLVAALSISLYANFRPASALLEMPDPVSILIADFENNTGNVLFTGVLEDTLRLGVEVAAFIEVFPRRDARQAAQRLLGESTMERPLNSENSRLVAIQEGIDIVVAGRIEKDAEKITVTLLGTEMPEQTQLFRISESAESDGDVLSAIARLAKELRYALGDYEHPEDRGVQESFSTSNLEAAAEYLRAQDLSSDRDLEEAIRHYSRAVELDSKLVRAYVGRAMARTFLGQSAAAAADWEIVLPQLSRLTERGRLRTLSAYYGTVTQDWQKALETSELFVERFPADSAGLNNVAVAAFYNLDFDRAREAGRIVAQRYPGRSLYKANLALYSMYASDFADSIELAKEVMIDNPESTFGWVAAALSLSITGNSDEARDIFQRMKELGYYGNTIALEGLADMEIFDGNYQAAIDILTDGISLDIGQDSNENAAVKNVMLAESRLALNEWNNAMLAVQYAIDMGSSDYSIVGSALLLVELGELERAESIADDLSRSLSKTRRGYANIIGARVAQSRSNFLGAIDASKAAIELADLWLGRYVLGNSYLDAGYAVEAYGEFQICKDRIGEGLSVYLDDRPTLRMIGKLETSIAATDELLRASLMSEASFRTNN